MSPAPVRELALWLLLQKLVPGLDVNVRRPEWEPRLLGRQLLGHTTEVRDCRLVQLKLERTSWVLEIRSARPWLERTIVAQETLLVLLLLEQLTSGRRFDLVRAHRDAYALQTCWEMMFHQNTPVERLSEQEWLERWTLERGKLAPVNPSEQLLLVPGRPEQVMLSVQKSPVRMRSVPMKLSVRS